MTETNLVIGFVLYTITLAGAAFAFGAIWSKKQDKTFCEEREKERLRVINTLYDLLNSLTLRTGILENRLVNIEKLINIEARVQVLIDMMKGAN